MRKDLLGIGILVLCVETAAVLALILLWLPGKLDRLEGASGASTKSSPSSGNALEKQVVDLKNAVEKLRFSLQRDKGEADGKTLEVDGEDEKIDTALERLDELATQIYDFERETYRNLMLLQKNIMRRITRLGAGGGNPHVPADPEKLARMLEEGGIRLDTKAKTIRFDGRLVTPTRPLEMVAATPGGPMHEALMEVHGRPSALYAALVTLGCKKGGGADMRAGTAPHGEKIHLYVTWPGLERPERLEDLLVDSRDESPMKEAQWVFSGSSFDTNFRTGEDFYIPDEARLAISLTHNFNNSAVIACDQKDAANEHIWIPNQTRLPDSDSIDVTIIVSLEELEPASKDEGK